MNNIFVVGTSGSGKSTLAKFIADELAIPHIEMDAVLWLPNWQKREPNEFKDIIDKEMAANPRVVIDGNFLGKNIEPVAGDTLVLLDLPRIRVFSRILRRSLRRVIFREKLWSGNQEEWRFLLSRDPELNPILFSWISHQQRRVRYSEYASSRPDLKVIRITNQAELGNLRKAVSSL